MSSRQVTFATASASAVIHVEYSGVNRLEKANEIGFSPGVRSSSWVHPDPFPGRIMASATT